MKVKVSIKIAFNFLQCPVGFIERLHSQDIILQPADNIIGDIVRTGNSHAQHMSCSIGLKAVQNVFAAEKVCGT